MSKKTDAAEARNEAIAKLRELTPQGSTVFTIVRHVSKSGMTRHISVMTINGDRNANGRLNILHPNYLAAEVLGWKRVSAGTDSIVAQGCGMDMGVHLVHSLSKALYGDGYALQQEWL